MRKYFCLLILTALLSACNSPINSKKARGGTMSIRKVKNNNSVNLKSMIQGRWGGLRDTESNFAILGDTIFYYDNAEAFHYLLTNDKISIEDGAESIWKIKMLGKDTFVMIGMGKNKGGQDTLRRYKN